MDSLERRERLAKSAERLIQLLHEDAPDALAARECVNIFRHALATYEDVAGDLFTKWLIRSVRVNCNQCADCGNDLDKRIAGPPVCPTCARKGEVDFMKNNLAHGEDAIEFDPKQLD